MQASLNACRWVYNKTLETRKRAWEELKVGISLYDTANMLPQWKKDNPFLVNAYSQTLQEAQNRVDLAFKAFFRRCKNGEKPGYPRFKGYDRYNSFTYPQGPAGGFSGVADKLRLSRIGLVKIKIPIPIEGQIKTLNIRKTSTGKWYAIFTCEFEPAILPKVDQVVGIDVGLASFATMSDGTKIDNPRFFKRDQAKLTKQQRRFEIALKGTKRRKEIKKRVAKTHERISNKRRDFAHKQSRKLINSNQIICFEDLNVQNMINNHTETFGHKLNKSIQDVAWKQFMDFTTYKAEWAGRQVVFVNPRNTSKRCSQCGQLVEKDLSVRVHECPCGLVLSRDHNAAINILALGMQSLASA